MLPVSCASPKHLCLAPIGARRRKAGIALLEILIAVLILGIGAGAAISALASANRVAEVNRSRIAALALCQERIDQIVGSPFKPPGTMPAYLGTAWPVPVSETVTSTESVQLFSDPNGVGNVPGTRTTRVSLADANLNLVRVTARVSYTYRGTNYTCEAFTLRSPD